MRSLRFLAVLLGGSALLAQQAPLFPTPNYFRYTFQRPQTHVALQPPVRLEDYAAGGKLELSLRNFIELVMANNTDIAIQRLSIEVPRNNIMRAFGTFDPGFSASIRGSRAKEPSTSSLAGANLLNSLNQSLDMSYTQILQSGTQFSLVFGGTKASSNNSFSTYNPSFGSSLAFSFAQPLLRNRGFGVTRLPISLARSTLRKSEYDLRDQLMQLVLNAENAYWDVVESRENLKVQQDYLKLNGESLKRSQRELELGAMSPLDIYRPQQQYASAEIGVSRFQFQLAQREDALRRMIGADLDPKYRTMPIVLTETVMPPLEEPPLDAEAAVQKALNTRPDLKSARQTLDIDELNIRSYTNVLRPDVSLTAGYTARGRGGRYFDSDANQTVPGGFGDAFSQVFGFDVPTYTFGLSMRFPIRDRRAQADLANGLVQKKLDVLRVRGVEQRVRLDVLNAVNSLESSKAGVKLAKVASEFAKKQVEAEQRKYDLGTSVMFFVLQAQTDQATAESELVRQSIEYRRSLVNLLRYTGELLDERRIVIQ